MPALPITDSPDISSLDSKITADLCGGNFIVDVTPSVFKSGGAANVQGASVQITNPVGIIIRGYITSGEDIVPPMTGNVTTAIPLVAANYLYGSYEVAVRLTDSLGTQYTVTKTVNICQPDSKDKNKKYGCLNASIQGNCKDGKVVVMLNQVPTYKGTISSSQVNALTVDYPTVSGLDPINTAMGSFSIALFEGEYIVTGTVCAIYNYSDNIVFKIPYHVNCKKNIICSLDECCIQSKRDELNAQLNSDCTDAEKENTSAIILQMTFLVDAAKGAAECGLDPSDYIAQLEKLLGCSCTCNCNPGTPIINNAPVKDFTFTGCGFEQNTTGNTTEIDIHNYAYVIAGDKDGVITSGAPVVDEDTCTVTQTLDISPTALAAVLALSEPALISGLLTQSGTASPTALIHKNSSLATLSYTRTASGDYVLHTSTNLFTATNFEAYTGSTSTASVVDIIYGSANTLLIKVSGGDGTLSNTAFRIYIY